MSRGTLQNGESGGSGGGSLTPSDQLLAIFAVNVILLVWVAWSLYAFYDLTPHLPPWMYWAESILLVLSVLLASWPRLRAIAERRPDPDRVPEVNVTVLKGAVFLFTAMDVVILWELAEATGGVLSPYAPFLPAPAIFASFVTEKWQTILGLSLAVVGAIALSTMEVPNPRPDIKAYQGTAAVMVLLAGFLTAVQVRVTNTGEPITGRVVVRDDTSLETRPSAADDDDDLPSTASP